MPHALPDWMFVPSLLSFPFHPWRAIANNISALQHNDLITDHCLSFFASSAAHRHRRPRLSATGTQLYRVLDQAFLVNLCNRNDTTWAVRGDDDTAS